MRPTLQDISDYAQMTRSPVNATKFFRYYERSNWESRGMPIENWQALFDAWTKHERPKPPQPAPDVQTEKEKPKEAFYDVI